VVLRLAEQADVFVEGFAPGTADDMGLGWDVISARSPSIVYGSLSAFGETGPYGGRPGFDHVVQAVSGIMPATGFEGQPPTKVGSPYLDYGGGLLLAFGILAGILEQRRTAKAVHIDVSMLDAGLLLNAGALVRTANTGANPPRTGNEAFSGAVASGAFATTDAMLMVAANKTRHFVELMKILDLDDLADTPELASPNADRVQVADAKRRMGERFATNSAQYWETLLADAKIPAARVRSLNEVTGEGHPAARGTLQPLANTTDGPNNGATLLPGAGVQINGVMPGPYGQVPDIGAHTTEVLTRWGFSPGEIADLAGCGVIGGP